MFYAFPQNKRYMINKDLVVKLDDEVVETTNGVITVKIYGKKKKVGLLWMYGMSIWDIRMPEEYMENLYKLDFKPINLKTHKMIEDVIPVFKEPVTIKGKYRMIPNLPMYAISSIGEVWNIIEEKVEYPNIRSGYLHLMSPYKNKMFTIHRLVALCWVPNDDFIAKPIVNHIDGNKLNCNKNNLEWNSFSDNARHAIASGLSTQAESYLVLDMETDEEMLFNSVTDLSKYVGLNTIPHLSSRIARHSQYVVSKRYLIKSSENTGPWLRDPKPDNNIVYRNEKTVMDIEAKNLNTGEIISGTVTELSDRLGINRSTLDGLRRKFKQHTDYGYIFRDPSYMEWDDIDVITHTLKPKQIMAIDVDTKEELVFKSLRETARFLKCDKKNIARRLNTHNQYKSYIFKSI